MNDVHIHATPSTPSILATWETGLVRLAGSSFADDICESFSPLAAWIERYLRESDRPLRLELCLSYLNNGSVKAMMELFDLLEEAHRGGRMLQLIWHYDPRNESAVEIAKEFREGFNFPFIITPLHG